MIDDLSLQGICSIASENQNAHTIFVAYCNYGYKRYNGRLSNVTVAYSNDLMVYKPKTKRVVRVVPLWHLLEFKDVYTALSGS